MLRSCSRKRPATFCFRGKRMLHCSVFAEKFDTKVIVWRISHDKISCFTKEIVSLFCEKYLSQLLSSPDYHSKGGEFVPAQLTKKKNKARMLQGGPPSTSSTTNHPRPEAIGGCPSCLPSLRSVFSGPQLLPARFNISEQSCVKMVLGNVG